MSKDVHTEADFYSKVFKKWLDSTGHKNIFRVEHARLPDVETTIKGKLIKYELKIGKFTLEPNCGNVITVDKVRYQPGQLPYARKINEEVPGTVRVAICDKDQKKFVIISPTRKGQRPEKVYGIFYIK